MDRGSPGDFLLSKWTSGKVILVQKMTVSPKEMLYQVLYNLLAFRGLFWPLATTTPTVPHLIPKRRRRPESPFSGAFWPLLTIVGH